MVQTKMGRYWEQAKGWFFRKVWPFQTKEGRQTKVSQVCPTCESKKNVRTRKENLPLQGNGQLPMWDQNQLTLQHLQKEKKAADGGMIKQAQKIIEVVIFLEI